MVLITYYAHASGQFKESEKHYHVIYKEILAVKYGIQKFEFHLIGHNFLVKLDNSSFPKILDLKNKTLPDKHLLRLKTWFSKYDFSVQHIKGDQNLIPDLLSRPLSSASLTIISSSVTVPVIFMTYSFPNSALTRKSFPCNLNFSSPYQIQDFAKKFVFQYFMNIYQTQSSSFPSFHPDHLFLTGLTIDPSRDNKRWNVVPMVPHCFICYQDCLSCIVNFQVPYQSNPSSFLVMDSLWMVLSSILVEKTTQPYRKSPSPQSFPWSRRWTIHLSLYCPPSLLSTSYH